VTNVAKSWDNAKVSDFLDGYFSAGELCRDYPEVDDILSGVLALKTAGDTSTRSLSRQVLFRILQCCPAIDVASIDVMTNGQYSYRSLAGYAAAARVASKALAEFADRMRPGEPQALSFGESRKRLDAPYAIEASSIFAT